MVLTLEQGAPEQKLEIIRRLDEMGADACELSPSLVKAAIGQDLSSDEIGGAKLHASLSGTIDFREKDDAAAIERLRRLAAHWPPPPTNPFRRETPRARPERRC